MDRLFHLRTGCMGVNLGSPQVRMAQYILQNADIHIAIPIHQCCRSMAQLMNGVPRPAQADFFQVFFNHNFYSDRFDARTTIA